MDIKDKCIMCDMFIPNGIIGKSKTIGRCFIEGNAVDVIKSPATFLDGLHDTCDKFSNIRNKG